MQLVRPNGSSDFCARSCNFLTNSAIIAVAGVSLGVISHIALKALGFSKTAAAVSALPLAIGTLSAASGLAIGVTLFIGVSILACALARDALTHEALARH